MAVRVLVRIRVRVGALAREIAGRVAAEMMTSRARTVQIAAKIAGARPIKQKAQKAGLPSQKAVVNSSLINSKITNSRAISRETIDLEAIDLGMVGPEVIGPEVIAPEVIDLGMKRQESANFRGNFGIMLAVNSPATASRAEIQKRPAKRVW